LRASEQREAVPSRSVATTSRIDLVTSRYAKASSSSVSRDDATIRAGAIRPTLGLSTAAV